METSFSEIDPSGALRREAVILKWLVQEPEVRRKVADFVRELGPGFDPNEMDHQDAVENCLRDLEGLGLIEKESGGVYHPTRVSQAYAERQQFMN